MEVERRVDSMDCIVCGSYIVQTLSKSMVVKMAGKNGLGSRAPYYSCCVVL
jgi:hypothetical protein